MNFTDLNFGFETVRWLVMSAIGVYAWIIGRQSASSKELLDLRTRIAKLESDLQQMPNQQQVHELALQVSRLNASVTVSLDAMGQRVGTMSKAVDRLESYLLHRK